MFLTEEEQLALHAIALMRMPDQHDFLQLATLPTRAMRELDWIPPALTPEERAAELSITVFSQPAYTPHEVIEAEEREGLQRVAKKASGSRNGATPPAIEQPLQAVEADDEDLQPGRFWRECDTDA